MIGDDFTGTVYGLPESFYHAHSALSSTQAKALDKSGAHYKHLLTAPPVVKREYDLGSAVHALVLGVGYPVVEIKHPDWRTNASKQEAAEARAAEKIPLLTKEYAVARKVADSVLMNETARVLFERDGSSEVSMFGTDPATGIRTRCRWDFLPNPDPNHARVAVDLKTTYEGKGALDKASSTIADFGYHISRSHYRDTSVFAGDPVDEMVFVFVEKEPPYLVSTIHINEQFQEIGDWAAARARRRLRTYTDTDTWPGYPDRIQPAAPPAWLIYKYLDGQNADYEETLHRH